MKETSPEFIFAIESTVPAKYAVNLTQKSF